MVWWDPITISQSMHMKLHSREEMRRHTGVDIDAYRLAEETIQKPQQNRSERMRNMSFALSFIVVRLLLITLL
jgi:hypothetical protein